MLLVIWWFYWVNELLQNECTTISWVNKQLFHRCSSEQNKYCSALNQLSALFGYCEWTIKTALLNVLQMVFRTILCSNNLILCRYTVCCCGGCRTVAYWCWKLVRMCMIFSTVLDFFLKSTQCALSLIQIYSSPIFL